MPVITGAAAASGSSSSSSVSAPSRSVRRKSSVHSGQIEKRVLMTKKEKDREINLTRKRIIISSQLNRRINIIKTQELAYLETFEIPVKEDLSLLKEREDIKRLIEEQINISQNQLNEFKNIFLQQQQQ